LNSIINVIVYTTTPPMQFNYQAQT